ncbi:zinc/manganese transport system ATP-binding protein [Herbihabitans rhizosphaerae]|uniref:Zinc/manganese transport system ATP-binding protein n=1 Tax=Herbihabitans rhizosphaerae TaxID=1872711 RepID=A0A4Q7KYM4_9PSEU|nr:metal ABC transporter ATP-binding protein [Herbihabitans rhizosphaerae]RZS41161.1 zinc/manganese transport system ATP-binding protein [Herbihabitans rhizosphaerae]
MTVDNPTDTTTTTSTAISLRGATLSYGDRVLWDGLDLDIAPGEFVAVLGPNGSGKTSLLRVLLGLQRLSAGTVEVAGARPGRASRSVGYIPQQRALDPSLTVRGRDLVGLGLDGHRWGIGFGGMRDRRRRVTDAVAAVGATDFADRPVGLLSGGEQQRLRVAQALVGDPAVLLCDEPLLSLDIANQRAVSTLIDKRRRDADTAVVFVTHEINPVLPLVDRVLYLVDGRFRIGTPDEVMTSKNLSELYRAAVEVIKVRGQIHVVGVHSGLCEDESHHHLAEAE